MKSCSLCKRELPLEEFSLRGKSNPDVRKNQCKSCIRARSADHYRANRAGYVERSRKNREQLAEVIREVKMANPCMDCGVNYPYYVMDFDHLPGSNKLFDMARGSVRGIRAALEEMAKCELVCSNCHRERTHQRAQATYGTSSALPVAQDLPPV